MSKYRITGRGKRKDGQSIKETICKKPKTQLREELRHHINHKVGLHCHCVEIKEVLLKLLEKARSENIDTLCIPNYRSVRIYTEVIPLLSDSDLDKYKEIKLVPSVELPGMFNYTNLDGKNYNIEVHILAYGVDIEKEGLLESFCTDKYKGLEQEPELKRLIKIGHELGLNFSDEDAKLDPKDKNRKFAGYAFMQALMKNMDDNFCKEGENNPNKLPFYLREDWRGFHNICVKDINSPFYKDMSSYNPNVSEVIQLIHDMGGKAYLAHPSGYFSSKDKTNFKNETINFARTFMKSFSPQNKETNSIDGIEAFHMCNGINTGIAGELYAIGKTEDIGISGGTDYRDGDTRPTSNVMTWQLTKIRHILRKAQTLFELREQAYNLGHGNSAPEDPQDPIR